MPSTNRRQMQTSDEAKAAHGFLLTCLLIFLALDILLLIPFDFLKELFLPAYRAEFFDTQNFELSFPFIFNSISNWSNHALVFLALSAVAAAGFLLRFGNIIKRAGNGKENASLGSAVAISAVLPLALLFMMFAFSMYSFSAMAISQVQQAVHANLSQSTFMDLLSFGAELAVLVGGNVLLWLFASRLLLPQFDLQVTEHGMLIWTQNRMLRKFLGSRFIEWKEVKSAVTQGNSDSTRCVFLELFDGSKYKLSFDSVKKSGPVAEFMLLLRDKSAARVEGEIQRRIDAQSNDYTELWLRYFSNPEKRNRKSSLGEGEIVHGRYRVLSTLGQGGQGTAYLAELISSKSDSSRSDPSRSDPSKMDPSKSDSSRSDPSKSDPSKSDSSSLNSSNRSSTNSVLVLKEYILPFHRGEEVFRASLNKLQKEAAILARIHHPNIVELKDSFVEDHRGYIVLEYLQGESLSDTILRCGPLSEPQVIEIALQICNAVEYMHTLESRIIHRDLTPDNFILQENGQVKLVDFNVAHQLESSATNTVVGKHAYISPEQFRGKASEQSDIYAMGGTLFFLLTGEEPTPMSVSSPRAVNNAVSEELDAIVQKATTLDTAERYKSAFEMRADLFDLARSKHYILTEQVLNEEAKTEIGEKIQVKEEAQELPEVVSLSFPQLIE